MLYAAELMKPIIKSIKEKGKYTLVVRHNCLCGAVSDQTVKDRSDDLRVRDNLITKLFINEPMGRHVPPSKVADPNLFLGCWLP